jgi:hypothetical protein
MYNVNFPPQTNQATFNPIIQVNDQDTGGSIDLADVDITFEIRNSDSYCCLLTATKDNGRIILISGDDGVECFFQPTFSADDLSGFDAGTYRIHCKFSRDGTSRDILIGTLPIVCP